MVLLKELDRLEDQDFGNTNLDWTDFEPDFHSKTPAYASVAAIAEHFKEK